MIPGELLRSSTFRLAVLYMGLFAGSVLFLLGFIYWSTVAFMSAQVDTTIDTEIVGLAEQYRERGLNGLVGTITDRVERNPDSSSIYLFASPSFVPLAGNLSGWPAGVPTEAGWLNFELEAPNGDGGMYARARVFELQGGFRLLVGRDVLELETIRQLIERALWWGLAITVALGLAGGITMSRGMLRRIEQINATSRDIMGGDLARRVPISGSSDEFDQLAANLNAMLDEIERLMAGIQRVSDNIAHDLRTPLTRLRNRLEVLHDTSRRHDGNAQQVEACIADADQLLKTFGALLRISRLEAGGHRINLKPVDLGALTRDAVDLYEALAEDRGIQLQANVVDTPKVAADRDLLFQAVANLLDNALKFSPTGSTIRLDVIGHDDVVDLSVSDNGPGIASEERDRVTQRFYRGESSRTTPGSGLGLSLVEAVAHAHSARLLLTDNNPGLVATLRLPADSRDYSSAP